VLGQDPEERVAAYLQPRRPQQELEFPAAYSGLHPSLASDGRQNALCLARRMLPLAPPLVICLP
jgi:hypothetical protein